MQAVGLLYKIEGQNQHLHRSRGKKLNLDNMINWVLNTVKVNQPLSIEMTKISDLIIILIMIISWHYTIIMRNFIWKEIKNGPLIFHTIDLYFYSFPHQKKKKKAFIQLKFSKYSHSDAYSSIFNTQNINI